MKDLFSKARCKIGLHPGEWRSGSTPCGLVRICERCGDRSEKTVHSWADWAYTADNSCDQVQQCRRCGEVLTRRTHVWGEAVHLAPGRCDQIRSCTRCAEQAPSGVLHEFDTWAQVGEGSCEEAVRCGRCGAGGAGRRTVHHWGDLAYSDAHGGAVRVCSRCGESEFRPVVAGTASPPPESAAPVPQPPPAAPPIDPERAKLFAALKPKMTQLSEMMEGMGGVADRMDQDAERAIADLEEDERAGPPLQFSDKDVADLLARAGGGGGGTHTARDGRLEGAWNTATPSMSGFKSELHLVLDTSGAFQRSSRTWGPMGPVDGTAETGTWSTVGNELVLTYDDGTESRREYHVEGRQLLFPDERRWPKIWLRG